VTPSDPYHPTNRNARFVAPEEARSRELRLLLAALLRFVRKERPLPGATGEISLWICQFWGLGRMRQNGAEIEINGSYVPSAEGLRNLGPQLNPEIIKERTARSFAIQSDKRFKRMMEAAAAGDAAEFNAGFKVTMEALIALWLPDFKPPFELSLDVARQMIRAFRTTLICIALDRVHPVTLIAKAWNGDKAAVLALIRADKLFLLDRCTQAVIRDAGLENDQPFMNELARAQQYQLRLRRRDLLHIYFDLLFLLEELGQALPRRDELQRLLDPHGTVFRGSYAFERDLQRQRENFMKLIEEASTQLPVLLSLYGSDLPAEG